MPLSALLRLLGTSLGGEFSRLKSELVVGDDRSLSMLNPMANVDRIKSWIKRLRSWHVWLLDSLLSFNTLPNLSVANRNNKLSTSISLNSVKDFFYAIFFNFVTFLVLEGPNLLTFSLFWINFQRFCCLRVNYCIGRSTFWFLRSIIVRNSKIFDIFCQNLGFEGPNYYELVKILVFKVKNFGLRSKSCCFIVKFRV